MTYFGKLDQETMQELFDTLLDERCELFGVRNTISWLADLGYEKEDLLAMRFDENDVDYVLAHPDEEYDCV